MPNPLDRFVQSVGHTAIYLVQAFPKVWLTVCLGMVRVAFGHSVVRHGLAVARWVKAHGGTNKAVNKLFVDAHKLRRELWNNEARLQALLLAEDYYLSGDFDGAAQAGLLSLEISGQARRKMR